jgi:hypothetical protein
MTNFETIEHEEPVEPISHWKNFSVGVFGASGEQTIGHMAAMINARQVGLILARAGYDGVNGGYGSHEPTTEKLTTNDGIEREISTIKSAGSMGAFGEGFNVGCDTLGIPVTERLQHLRGVVMNPKVSIGAAEKRGL